MRVKSKRQVDNSVQMGPLIDCVFLLLIFFIVIAVTKKSIKQLGIMLPPPTTAVTPIKPKDKDLVFRVTSDGKVYAPDREVGQQGVLDYIRKKRAENPRQRVRFEIDRNARFIHFYPIMDQLKQYGLNDWSFRTTMD